MRSDLESEADFASDAFLGGGEDYGIAYFLPVFVSLHLAVESRRLSRLGVSVIRADRVHLQDTAGSLLTSSCLLLRYFLQYPVEKVIQKKELTFFKK